MEDEVCKCKTCRPKEYNVSELSPAQAYCLGLDEARDQMRYVIEKHGLAFAAKWLDVGFPYDPDNPGFRRG